MNSAVMSRAVNRVASSAPERLKIAPVTGAGRLHFHVYYEEFFDGTIHEDDAGWHWSSHLRVLGPFATSLAARDAVIAFYAGLQGQNA